MLFRLPNVSLLRSFEVGLGRSWSINIWSRWDRRQPPTAFVIPTLTSSIFRSLNPLMILTQLLLAKCPNAQTLESNRPRIESLQIILGLKGCLRRDVLRSGFL